jgi:ABC-type Mn2+/Zn2+ transport system permease subunit
MELLNTLISPFTYEFMVKATLISALTGAICAVLSCFVILKGWSLMGDAVSHSVLPGVVLAYVVGLPYALGAFVFGLLSVVSIGYIKARSRVKEDTVIGVVFTGLFALGFDVQGLERGASVAHFVWRCAGHIGRGCDSDRGDWSGHAGGGLGVAARFVAVLL